MNAQHLYDRLAHFGPILESLTRSISPNEACWKPADGGWSILEILRHLVDEEAEDFRPRVQRTLANPTKPWTAWAPQESAIARNYNEGKIETALEQFLAERQRSLKWLKPNLESIEEKAKQSYDHPKFGPIKLGDLFVSWVAHDQLHLRQIAKRRFELTERDGAPFSTAYGGNW